MRAPSESRRAARLGAAVLRAVFLYGVLVWAYLALNYVTHPRTVVLPLTHFASWPTEGDAAAACFLASAAAFLALRTARHRRREGSDAA